MLVRFDYVAGVDTEDFECRLYVSDRNAVQLTELARQRADHSHVVRITAFYLDAEANPREQLLVLGSELLAVTRCPSGRGFISLLLC